MTPECSERGDPFAVRKTLNVVLLGLVFMLLASRTPISIVKTVLYSATDVSGVGYIEGFNGDGYVANAILYSTFAVSNFLAPWLISIVGPKYVPKTVKDDGSETFAKSYCPQTLQGSDVRWRVWLHPLLCSDALPI